jgi:hypothetical protein
MRWPFTSSRYRLSAAIHPVARRSGAVTVTVRRKSTNVLGRQRSHGYQIHFAGSRSGSSKAAGWMGMVT